MGKKYTSKYSPEKKVENFQLIIELICENRAKSLDIQLPIKFWSDENWAKFYKAQLRQVHKLLKTYEALDLIKVIKEKNIWSLHSKWIIEEFNKERDKPKPQTNTEHTRIINSTGQQTKDKNMNHLDE